jgi:hypothetical protein
MDSTGAFTIGIVVSMFGTLVTAGITYGIPAGIAQESQYMEVRIANRCASDRYYHSNQNLCEQFKTDGAQDLAQAVYEKAKKEQERKDDADREACADRKFYYNNYQRCDGLGVSWEDAIYVR